MIELRIFAVSALSMLAATAVSAATLTTHTFDLQRTGSGGDAGTLSGNQLTVTDGGLTGVFTGGYYTGATYTGGSLDVGDTISANSVDPAYDVLRHYNGLGVCNDGPCKSSDPFHTVDGTSSTTNGQLTDFVQMSFFDGTTSVAVQLTSLTFGWVGNFSEGGARGYVGTNGSFEVILDTFGIDGIGIGDTLGAFGTAIVNLALPGTGTAFVDLASSGLFDDTFGVKAGINGSWKLRSATVQYMTSPPPPPPPPPAVPLPAAGWLILGGLGSLAAVRRNRRRG